MTDIVPSDERLIDLPAEDDQAKEIAKEDQDVLDFAQSKLYQHIVRVKLEAAINKYQYVKVNPSLSDKEIADAVRLGQTISGVLQEILDDVDRTVGFYQP